MYRLGNKDLLVDLKICKNKCCVQSNYSTFPNGFLPWALEMLHDNVALLLTGPGMNSEKILHFYHDNWTVGFGSLQDVALGSPKTLVDEGSVVFIMN